MKAEEARIIAIEAIKKRNDAHFEEIMKEIEAYANLGLFHRSTKTYISEEHKKRLEDLGYEISINSENLGIHKISWK